MRLSVESKNNQMQIILSLAGTNDPAVKIVSRSRLPPMVSVVDFGCGVSRQALLDSSRMVIDLRNDLREDGDIHRAIRKRFVKLIVDNEKKRLFK